MIPSRKSRLRSPEKHKQDCSNVSPTPLSREQRLEIRNLGATMRVGRLPSWQVEIIPDSEDERKRSTKRVSNILDTTDEEIVDSPDVKPHAFENPFIDDSSSSIQLFKLASPLKPTGPGGREVKQIVQTRKHPKARRIVQSSDESFEDDGGSRGVVKHTQTSIVPERTGLKDTESETILVHSKPLVMPTRSHRLPSPTPPKPHAPSLRLAPAPVPASPPTPTPSATARKRGRKPKTTKEIPQHLPTIGDKPAALFLDDIDDWGSEGVLTFNEPRSTRKPVRLPQPTDTPTAPPKSTPVTARKRGRPPKKAAVELPPSLDADTNRVKDLVGTELSKAAPPSITPSTPRRKSPTKPRMTKKEKERAEHERRKIYAQELFNDLNAEVFGNKLPKETKLCWNKRLLTTAGKAKWHRHRDGSQTTEIELAEKILVDEERIRLTLSHEMCHLASWVIDQSPTEGHGRIWKAWTDRVMRRRPDIKISTKHNYEITYPYQWKCIECEKIYGRFSKSIDTTQCVCGVCKVGRLEPLFTTRAKNTATPRSSKLASDKPMDSPIRALDLLDDDDDDDDEPSNQSDGNDDHEVDKINKYLLSTPIAHRTPRSHGKSKLFPIDHYANGDDDDDDDIQIVESRSSSPDPEIEILMRVLRTTTIEAMV